MNMMLSNQSFHHAQCSSGSIIRAQFPDNLSCFLADNTANICFATVKDNIIWMETFITRIVPFIWTENAHGVDVHPVTSSNTFDIWISVNDILCFLRKTKLGKVFVAVPSPENISFPIDFNNAIVDKRFI